MKGLRNFLVSENAATATEYAVMLALIIVVAIGAIGALGTKVTEVFNGVEGAMPDAAAPS